MKIIQPSKEELLRRGIGVTPATVSAKPEPKNKPSKGKKE
jgi:hypothetical protein